MFTKETHALLKPIDEPGVYMVMEKKTRAFVLMDNREEAIEIINNLLDTGAEVYDSLQEFSEVYPPLTAEQRKKMMEDGE